MAWSYRRLGEDSLFLGRDRDAISFLEKALAMDREDEDTWIWAHSYLACAYARTGRIEEAKRAEAEVDRHWSYHTVRGHYPNFALSETLAAQIRNYQDGMKLAGERDHAEEDADFGVQADGELHTILIGLTPKAAPGVKVIRTIELAGFLAEARPVIVDTLTNSWGRSLPGAIGLRYAGVGGSVDDAGQEHLRIKMNSLTGGDLNRPVVTVGLNSERFDSRNFALRLAALGYTQVYWYRGGREAWEVASLPETPIDVQEW
jgi:adenylate cyclase